MLVSEPDAPWRSRMRGDVWEVNDAHEDYVTLRDSSAHAERNLGREA
jgi:hypothetical protein